MQQDLEKSLTSSKKSSLMEKNLIKMRTITSKLISPYYAEGHTQVVIDKLQQIELPPIQIDYVHVSETMEEAHKMIFYDGPQLIQGQLQDREFLNALSLISSNQSLFNCFIEGEDRIIFKFYKKMVPYSVVVDETIPAFQHLPKYGRSKGNGSWVSLFEKAYAVLNGGYEFIAGVSLRDSLRDLSGLDPEIVMFSKENINKQNFQQTLQKLYQNGSIIGFLQLSQIDCVVNKVYGQNEMHILNSISADGIYNLLNHFQGNEYNLNIEDLLSFNCLVVLKDFPDEYRGTSLIIKTTLHGVPSGNNQQWINNPNFQFQVGVGINQLEMPFVFRLSELESQEGAVTGILLMNQRDIRTFNQNNVIFMTKSNNITIGAKKQNYSSFFAILPKAYYTIYVFSTSKEPKQVQLDIFYAGKPSQLEFKFKGKQILEYCVGDNDNEYRIIRDKLPQLGIIPGNIRNLILKNPNVGMKELSYCDNLKADNEMAYLLEEQLQQELLGINLEGAEPQDNSIFDFGNYQLTDDAFQIMLPLLIGESNIEELLLNNNLLHDESILQLCYELDKAYHHELKTLDLSGNPLTGKSGDVLVNLTKKLKNLKIKADGNAGKKLIQQ